MDSRYGSRIAMRANRHLYVLLQEALEIGSRTLKGMTVDVPDPVHIPEDRRKQMVLLYASKQLEHLRSIYTLVGHGQDRDAWLISRVMLDGVTQLFAAHKDQVLIDEWFWYGIVQDWKVLMEQKENGEPVDPEKLRIAEGLLQEHGDNYLSTHAKKKKKLGKPLPRDPYRNEWSHLNAREFHRRAGAEAVYGWVYAKTSQWIHWSTSTLMATISDETEGEIFYNVSDPAKASIAMVYGIQSWQNTFRKLDQEFEIGVGSELTCICERLEVICNGAMESDKEGDTHLGENDGT